MQWQLPHPHPQCPHTQKKYKKYKKKERKKERKTKRISPIPYAETLREDYVCDVSGQRERSGVQTGGAV